MATKLKNMQLTSVDLVRAGANQEADICLFKSADPAEAAGTPTEGETNILKRFLSWLRENPTAAASEPQTEQEDDVEKSDETEEDIVDLYKSAITESLQSIVADDNLSVDEKKDLIEKSIGQCRRRTWKSPTRRSWAISLKIWRSPPAKRKSKSPNRTTTRSKRSDPQR